MNTENQRDVAANNQLAYFNDPTALDHYVSDQNIDFDKTAIIYEYKDWYWVVFEGHMDAENLPSTCMKGGWIVKSKVGGYLVDEWVAGDPNTTGSWKIHSPAIQDLRSTINNLIKADKMKVEAGMITDHQFMLTLTDFLHQITSNASSEVVYDKRDEQLEAEQLAEEYTDYDAYVKGTDKGPGSAVVSDQQGEQ